MLKKYEIETMIANAFEELDGLLANPDQDGKYTTVYSAKATTDDNGDLILTFKEDCFSDDKPDRYRVKIEYF